VSGQGEPSNLYAQVSLLYPVGLTPPTSIIRSLNESYPIAYLSRADGCACGAMLVQVFVLGS